MNHDSKFILLGKILSPHGVRGEVKVISYAEIAYNLIAYGPLFDKTGTRQFELSLRAQTSGGNFIASIKGVSDRDEAEKYRNIELYVPRSALPDPTGEQYYQTDLIGMNIITETGAAFGTVGAFHNFGAGTLVDVRFPDGTSELFAFTQATFPKIDTKAKTLTIVIPESIE